MKERIDDIEALRAIAVLAVVIYHANINLAKWTSSFAAYLYTYFGGWVGVDLFFTISGFVIARSLLPALRSSQGQEEFFSVSFAFWVRRIYRLLPSAWLWLFITLVLVVGFNDHGIFGAFRYNWQATLAALLNVMNFHMAETFGNGHPTSNFVYWSLSLEEQFYLLLPLAVFLARKWFVHVTLLLFVYQIVTPVEGVGMWFRTHSILGGILVAAWSLQPSYKLAQPTILGRSMPAKTLCISVLLLFLLSLGSYDILITSWRISMVALVSMILVFIASYNRDYIIPKQRILKGIVLWFGSRSYAIYLTHIPCFFFARELFLRLIESYPALEPWQNFGLLVVGPLLIAITSDLNYRLVETPLRRKGAEIARRVRERRAEINPELRTGDL